MERILVTKQDYDEFEMLLGEIPSVTSTIPHVDADAKCPMIEDQKGGKSPASYPCANLYHPPRVAERGGDAMYSISSFADNLFDQEIQGNRKINDEENDYKTENLDESYLPDDHSLTSALENLSTDETNARGLIIASPVKYNKASHIHVLQSDGQYLSTVKKSYSPPVSGDLSFSQTPHTLDHLNMPIPTLQEYPPPIANMIDKFQFQANNHADKLSKFNVHELMRQKPESLSGVLRDQYHIPGPMYSGSINFVPGRNAFQFFSGVPFAEFPSSGLQSQCYLETQSTIYMPPQHFSHPHITWQKFEEDKYCRMHQRCFNVQQYQNQEVPSFQKRNNASIMSFTSSPIQPYFELPASHHLEQTDPDHYLSRSVLPRGENQLGPVMMGGGSCQHYPQGTQAKEENFTYAHTQKQAAGSSPRYTSKDFKEVHALNRFGKQTCPKKILTRSQGSNSVRTLRSSPPTSNQSPIHAGSEGRVLPNGQLHPSFQISTSFQVDGRDCEGSSDNSGERLTARSPKPKFKSLNEAVGRIYALAKDPHGCRFLQEKFVEGTPEDVHLVFVEIIDHIVELMTDPYGNYLVQKMLESCNEDQKMCIIHAITRKDGELIRISCDMHGTRAVQKVIENLKTPEQVSTIISSLKPDILALVKDNNGNHVAQRCLQCLSPEFSKFLFDAVIAHCVELARDRRGCCVLQKCLSHCSGQQREQLMSEISSNALVLSQDPFGNYVVQYLLELNVAPGTEDVLDHLDGNFGHLSIQKYSSNVVEKCLTYAREDRRVRIIWELLDNPQLLQILQDPFGNFVIQTAIMLCKGALHADIMRVIRPHIPALRNDPYGRKVLARFSTKK